VREQYLMDVASRARMDADRLRPQLDEMRLEVQRRPPAPVGRAAAGGRGPSRNGGAGGAGSAGGGGGGGGSAGGGGWEEDVPWPSDAPWPSDSGDGGHGGDSGWAGPASAASSQRGRDGFSGVASGVSAAKKNGYYAEGPALEVLRHAVHNSSEVVAWLRPELFNDPAHRGALAALGQAPSISDAIAAAADESPAAADLLARLAVDEPSSEPFDAVTRLLTEVARSQLTGLRFGVETADDPTEALNSSAFLVRCIEELRTRDASVAAGERLLAWLGQRAGDGGID
jgi:hypothetical protein